jgi:hypothetical protein
MRQAQVFHAADRTLFGGNARRRILLAARFWLQLRPFVHFILHDQKAGEGC